MEKSVHDKLRKVHRINRLLWLSVLSGMIILNLLIFFFHQWRLIEPHFIENLRFYVDGLLLISVLLIFLSIYIKRNYLNPARLTERAKKRRLNIISVDVTDLLIDSDKKGRLLIKALIIMRRFYMVIWSITNLLVMIGFVQYIISLQFRIFMVYSIVGIYSLAINFPRFSLIENCYQKIEDLKMEEE